MYLCARGSGRPLAGETWRLDNEHDNAGHHSSDLLHATRQPKVSVDRLKHLYEAIDYPNVITIEITTGISIIFQRAIVIGISMSYAIERPSGACWTPANPVTTSMNGRSDYRTAANLALARAVQPPASHDLRVGHIDRYPACLTTRAPQALARDYRTLSDHNTITHRTPRQFHQQAKRVDFLSRLQSWALLRFL